MGLGPLSISGVGSPFIIWGRVPFQSHGLGPLSLYGAGSPVNLRGWVPFHYMGLGPLSISRAGAPFTVWGWIPFYCVGLGPLAIDWREDLLQIPGSLEHPSAFYGAQHVWFCPTANPDLRGWVAFYSVGLGPLSISGAGSPFIVWGWIPFYCVGLGPLAIDWREDLLQIPGSLEHPSAFYGAQHVWFCPTTDPNLRGWVAFYSVGLGPLSISGAGSPFIVWGWIPFCCVGLGPLAIDWREDLLQIPGSLEHPSAFYGAQHVWFCPTTDPNLRGWVAFYSVGLGPLSSYGAGSPSTLWGWVPSQSVGLGLLAIDWREDLLHIPGSLEHPSAFYGAQHVWFCPTADPDLRGWFPFFTVWGWVPFQAMGLSPLLLYGAGSPLNQWG